MPWYTTADARRDAEMQAAITDRDASRKLGNLPTQAPFGALGESQMIRIEENTFAAACYDQNTIAELEIINARGFADQADCAEWNLTAAEWRQQIELALAAKRADVV